MSAVGPAIWRTIGRELSVSPLSLRTTCADLTPLRRNLQPPRPWFRCLQPSMHGCRPKSQIVSFTSTAVWKAKVPIQPEQIPIPPQDAASAPLELKRVSPSAVQKIFGPRINHQRGNDILQALQEQRMAGTLDEGVPNVGEPTVNQGLEWLRTNYPLNEDAAIMSRLEREEAQESQNLIDRAEKLGIYRSEPSDEQPVAQVPTDPRSPLIYVPQQDPERNRILGTSLLDKKRDANKAAYQAEEAVKRAEAEAAEAEAIRIGKPVPTAETQAVVRRQKLVESKEQWIEHAESLFGEKDAEQKWPDMTISQRLWPSALLTAAVIGLSVLFATYYTPPPKKARIWPDTPPAAATMMVLIGINVVVFGAWHLVPLQRFMLKNFISVPGYPRAFSIIGCTFSHQTPMHLAMNMVVLWLFGTRVHDEIGRGPFLATYMACGAFSSFSSLAVHVFTSAFQTGALGASGVTAAIIATWCVINSDKQISIIFLPKEWTKWVPSLGFLALLIAGDLWLLRKGTMAKPFKGVDYVAHLGGYMGGIGAGVLINRKMHPKKKWGEPAVKDAQRRVVQKLP